LNSSFGSVWLYLLAVRITVPKSGVKSI